MSKNRYVKSIKKELIKKARESMLAAVQIYNNPQVTFKSETFITLTIIGWTYLLHAYYKSISIDYRYYKVVGKKKYYEKTKYGAFKHWELERCINFEKCPLDGDTKNNLKFLIGIRHEIEHQMTNKIDEYLSAKLQACALNFDFYICQLFGEKYNMSNELSLAIQFSPLSLKQQEILLNNMHVTSNVRNFIVDFEDVLTEEELENSHYAYRVLFVPINAKRKGQADQVVEFIKSDSPLADGIEKTYAVIKETEKKKYLPSDIVSLMKGKGFDKFTMTKHTDLWHARNAKDSKYNYGVLIVKTWYWYDSWLKEVEKYCVEHEEELKSNF